MDFVNLKFIAGFFQLEFSDEINYNEIRVYAAFLDCQPLEQRFR